MKLKIGHRVYDKKEKRFGHVVYIGIHGRQGKVIKLYDPTTKDKWFTSSNSVSERKPLGEDFLDDDVKVCSCALCHKTLIAPEDAHRANGVPVVAGRYVERPYCNDCLAYKVSA